MALRPALLLVVLLGTAAVAQTPRCERLDPGLRDRAQRLLAEQYVYDCCDRTIAACLTDTPTCRLAVRLADSVCRRLERGDDDPSIVRGLSRRARSMLARQQVDIDLAPTHAACAGADTARVLLVEYACARCPFCARITPPLYQEVTSGRLTGKVRFCFKVFPIRSHPYSKETGLGLIAALELGRFWPFLVHTYDHFDGFEMRSQARWAATAGMDTVAFSELVAAASTRERLVDSKKEGLRNGVDATPTFFIDGRRYAGSMDLEELVDVLLEAWERQTGNLYVQEATQP